MRVLLVDDNEINQLVAVTFLKKYGHSVVVANDGVEAVSAFQKEKFDVVLMDIHMPRMDGFEATAVIRRIEVDWGVRTPIIALTADTTKSCRQKVIAAEMDGYVPKPLNIADLLNEIRASVRCVAPCGLSEVRRGANPISSC